jgi:hypothetical protein
MLNSHLIGAKYRKYFSEDEQYIGGECEHVGEVQPAIRRAEIVDDSE